MSEFITFYVETAKNELKERGFIKKSDINFLRTSDRYDDCYFTRLSNINETLYVKKTDFDVEVEKQYAPNDHLMQAREYTLKAINTQINDKVLRQALASRMNYTTWLTIKECINLLSTDGKGTKQQVKERLEELIKDE